MKIMNDIKLSGRLYDFEVKFAEKKDGTPVQNSDGDTALTGRVTLEITENGNTVVVEYFAYPKWPSSRPNSSYVMLKDMMDKKMTSVLGAAESGGEPEWLELAGSIDVNYFVSKRTKELVQSLKVRGSFINDNKKKEYGAIWTADTLVTNIEHVDADPEKELPGYVRLDGYISNYREELNEVSFRVCSDEAIGKLPVAEASKEAPFYTMLRGAISFASRVVKSTDAFGDEVENEYENKVWEVQRYALEDYDFFDEAILGTELFEVKLKELAERKQAVVDLNTGGADKKPELNF